MTDTAPDITTRLRDWARHDRSTDREEAADVIDHLRWRLDLYMGWLRQVMRDEPR